MTRRLPISCENCRQRKIRCTGSGVPCDTCRRRGFTSSCHFKRDVEPFYADIQSNASQETLLQRISALERLLQQNIDLTSASINSQQSHTLRSPVSDAESGISTDNRPVSCLSALTSDYVTPLRNAAGIPDHGLGTLITSATGHVRYIPSNISCDSTLLGLFHEPIQPPAVSGFPFSFHSTTAHQSLLDMLPPSRQCGELISIFLDVFSPLFHILHDPTFQSTYTAFQNDPKSSSLAFLGLVFIALGLAVTALDKSHHLLSDLGRESSPAANIRSLAARYRSAAMKCLAADNFLWQHNLHTVQCLVLLIYAINHAHGPAWALLGTTLNIAVAIGCHVDPETLDNTCLGNLTPFRLDNKVRLPADLDDEDILPMSLGNEEVNAELNKQNPTKMSYILFKFRLYRLATDICHLVSATRIPDQMQVQALNDRIMLERNAQKDRFHGKPELPIYHQAHSYILDNYTNHLSLLLHRPCLGVEGQIESIARVQIGYERCEQAALAILSNFETLHSRPELQPYYCYAAEFMPLEEFMYSGYNYQFPQYTAAGNNNIISHGQEVQVPRGKYFSVQLLTAIEDAIASTTLNATYADGSTSFSGILGEQWHVWPYTFAGDIVFPYLFNDNAMDYNYSNIFQTISWVDSEKDLVSITFPDISSGSLTSPGGGAAGTRMHIFALTFSPASPVAASRPQLKVQYAHLMQKWLDSTDKA
ncbi:hypothetical protein CNMCM6106_001570 [Aspergillus hiratsukae]|uniref:Zn(2)-C6 fungal-type domain-containing protein n=1 Tax=Aspergillus hiratsukae TaxID=1194566 RepID=A0A8H6UWE8_9EURO|nr:hypothetical protein CNMCM6106_001570 [Aspergillus hiratsukae]